MEAIQILSHFMRGKYFGGVSPRAGRRGKLLLLASLFERRSREALLAYAALLPRDPLAVFRPVNIQSVLFVQPHSIKQDGSLGFFL